MFRKIHLKMTFFCTLIISIILIAMTLSGLYLFEGLLKKNDTASYERDRSTILAYLERETLIDYEQLSKMADNHVYTIVMFENSRRLSWSQANLTSDQNAMIQKACDEALNTHGFDIANPPKSKNITKYLDFKMDYSSTEHLVTFASLPNRYGEVCVLILYSRLPLRQQIMGLRIIFAVIDLGALLLILLFAWKFSGQILKPVEENRLKQVEFVAAASHELRSPLAVILSCTSALEVADENDRSAFFKSIHSEGKRMKRLIDDMLSLSNADTQAWSMHFEDTQLDTLLLDIFDKYLPVMQNKGQHLKICLEDKLLPHCQCDRQRMEQVLGILLDNAASYTPKAGDIQLGISSARGHLLLWVADNGPGIPDSSKKIIFDRFYRGDASRKDKRHFGLGLCIAKELIQLHQGKIWVEDNQPTGSVFYISLPAAL